ncbi:hypothetical protein EDB82DRAFT_284296 [Fusarium venenatum]|uniref:uncharacterized protein n=1 Tax=Fusarium venenatum TaxID=56646 RepID=UPI001D7E69BA|nr:hypothetical protein EDB82DRAFT_284296 [Fusarium venenatum]
MRLVNKMLDKNQSLSIGPNASLPMHIDMQQPQTVAPAQQSKDRKEPSVHDLKVLIDLQATAIASLERSMRLLTESTALLSKYIQRDKDCLCDSTRQGTMPDGKLGPTNSICNIENITVGKQSQQTIIVEGGGSIRARNITTGDGSIQLIGRFSNDRRGAGLHC